MIIWKIDPLKELKNRGISQSGLLRDKVFFATTLTHIKRKENVSLDTIDKLCLLLHMQPGDMIEFQADQESIQKYYKYIYR